MDSFCLKGIGHTAYILRNIIQTSIFSGRTQVYQFSTKPLRVHLFLEQITHSYYTCPCIIRHENVFIERFTQQFIVFASPDSAYGRSLRPQTPVHYVKT
jgi:hypothetical protein